MLCFVHCTCHVQAKVETVVRISAGKSREKEDSSTIESASNTTSTGTAAAGTPAASSGSTSNNTSSHSSHGDKDKPSVEKGVDRIIDSQDNEFVLSAPPKDQVATLTLDPLLIQDLTFLFASAAVSLLAVCVGSKVVGNWQAWCGSTVGHDGGCLHRAAG